MYPKIILFLFKKEALLVRLYQVLPSHDCLTLTSCLYMSVASTASFVCTVSCALVNVWMQPVNVVSSNFDLSVNASIYISSFFMFNPSIRIFVFMVGSVVVNGWMQCAIPQQLCHV